MKLESPKVTGATRRRISLFVGADGAKAGQGHEPPLWVVNTGMWWEEEFGSWAVAENYPGHSVDTGRIP